MSPALRKASIVSSTEYSGMSLYVLRCPTDSTFQETAGLSSGCSVMTAAWYSPMLW